MRLFNIACFGIALAGWCCGTSQAQDKAADAKKIEAVLDAFREDLFQLFNAEKYQEMLDKHVHKDVIATWQDGTTSKGHAGVIAEFDKLKKFINKMTVKPNTDQRLILEDGKLVIASGNMKDDYALARGNNVSLESRWQATLVRDDAKWVLVSFSASTNAFENQVIDLYLQKTQYTSAGVASVVGLLIGIVATLVSLFGFGAVVLLAWRTLRAGGGTHVAVAGVKPAPMTN